MKLRGIYRTCLLLLLFATISSIRVALPIPAQAQGNEFAPAEIVNDEGGAVSISGQLAYSNAFFNAGVAEPLVILEDQAGFVDRNRAFNISVKSQVLGQITTDFYSSPFSYTLALPIEPKASLRDVDQDGEEDNGVMVYAVAFWANIFGDPYLEVRDLQGGGWSIDYVSTRVSYDSENSGEYFGGKVLVYAPDDQQGFPSTFGTDERLFTEDDEIVGLPQGYTVVDLDTTPFTFDRSREARIDMIESDESAQEDFSQLSYTAAFDAMVEKFRNEYAFTDYKGIDWDAKSEEFRPRFEAAEAANDPLEYRRALRDFTLSIPDGHVSGPIVDEDFATETGGGLGMSIRDVDDGRTIVNYLVEDGPADAAGIEMRAEIIAINGTPIDEFVDDAFPWSGPFSNKQVERLQLLRYAVRSPVGTEFQVTFKNPGESNQQTITLTSIEERESHAFSSFFRGVTGAEVPVEFKLLDNGYGYVKIYSFFDNALLSIQLWERMMLFLNENEIPGLIVDMRQNGGGDTFLSLQMAAYFFDEPLSVGNTGYYDRDTDDFFFDPAYVETFIPPAEDLRYHGAVAVLISPNCASACEFFSYDMSLEGRAAIVGQYPTAGLGGSIDSFLMPEDEEIIFTIGRAVDMNGDIHIEGTGVPPTVQVPVNEETLFSDSDPVLDAAVTYLDIASEEDTVHSTP